MRIRIAAVGKLKEPYWRAACDEYLKRLSRYATVEIAEVPDRDLSAGAGRAVAAEGADLLRAVLPASYVIALEIGGTQRSSEQLSGLIEGLMVDGRSDVTFVVGAPAISGDASQELCSNGEPP